jgi:hypothetical protein
VARFRRLASRLIPENPISSSGPYPFLLPDLSGSLLLLMERLTDSAEDDGVISDFSAAFGLDKRAVLAAVRAYRQALGPDGALIRP